MVSSINKRTHASSTSPLPSKHSSPVPYLHHAGSVLPQLPPSTTRPALAAFLQPLTLCENLK
jgi:hypothetical protein